MKPLFAHRFDLSLAEARDLQVELAQRVELQDRLPDPIRRVAGLDCAVDKSGKRLGACAVILDAETLEVLEVQTAEAPEEFPYISGFLSFRELPVLARVLDQVKLTPDLIVCDGQGIAHPRRLGIASHLGVVFDVPTIGCAKSLLVGAFDEPGIERGAWTPLVHKGETIGSVLRTRTGTKPLFVSPGHRISQETARAWVLRLAPRYRLPETTRQADRRVGEFVHPERRRGPASSS